MKIRVPLDDSSGVHMKIRVRGISPRQRTVASVAFTDASPQYVGSIVLVDGNNDPIFRLAVEQTLTTGDIITIQREFKP
jgi:hypothetical protein